MKTILKFSVLVMTALTLSACGKTGDLTPVKSTQINAPAVFSA